MRLQQLPVVLLALSSFACGDPEALDGGTPDGNAPDDAGSDGAPPGDSGVPPDGSPGVVPLDGSRPDAGRLDAGPPPPSVLFADDFDSYPAMDLDGRCLGPDSAACGEATFPWERADFEPGWSFLWTGGGSGGSYPHVAQITSEGARGGAGMNLQMWDENEHHLGRSQWGHDFQLAKYWYPEQHEEIWLDMWVYWSSPVLRTTNQKMTHIFHYDRAWLDDGRNVFNTSESTDGGVICNWREASGTMEFRCSVRCSNPPDYRCTVGGAGAERVAHDGSDWGGRAARFELRTGASCAVPADGSYEAVFADGEWHRFEVGLRMNSAPGVADGELELWVDGCRLGLVRGVPFRETGADSGVAGFNGVTIGGNAQPNDWGADGTDGTTWQVDDVRICSERCP